MATLAAVTRPKQRSKKIIHEEYKKINNFFGTKIEIENCFETIY